MKNGFSMIELVFVIVVLGILASIAVPKFSATRTDAKIAKGRADISSIRSAIITERQSQIIKGTTTFIPKLTENTTDTILFKGNGTRTLLTYGISVGEWKHTAAKTYTYTVGGTTTTFDYNSTSGIFTCDTTNATYGEMCKKLIN